jgi:hypothetical protein
MDVSVEFLHTSKYLVINTLQTLKIMLPSITLNPDDYYYALNQPCTILPQLLEYVQSVEDWEGLDWHTFYLDIPNRTACNFDSDPVIKFFLDQGWRLNFTCMPPKGHYRWHIDNQGNRQTAINLALNGFETTKVMWRPNRPYVRKMNTEIMDIPYTPGTYFVFNTQEEHCVTNFSNENRYLLSITPDKRFAVPEYFDGIYKNISPSRYAEILKGYKLAFKEVVSEVKAQGW